MGVESAKAVQKAGGDKPDETLDIFPDIKIEVSRQGIENAKAHANNLFSQGSFEESVRWFSKAVWLVESKQIGDVSADLHSILHSNRAFSYIKLKKWQEAEQDCTKALVLNNKNTKATFRRALANYELGNFDDA